MYGLDVAVWTALLVAALFGKPCDDDQGEQQQGERPAATQTGGGS